LLSTTKTSVDVFKAAHLGQCILVLIQQANPATHSTADSSASNRTQARTIAALFLIQKKYPVDSSKANRCREYTAARHNSPLFLILQFVDISTNRNESKE
jgi:hypothetical protein